jgi:hypothetical protein
MFSAAAVRGASKMVSAEGSDVPWNKRALMGTADEEPCACAVCGLNNEDADNSDGDAADQLDSLSGTRIHCGMQCMRTWTDADWRAFAAGPCGDGNFLYGSDESGSESESETESGGESDDADDPDDRPVTFIRPSGDVETKTVGWCKTNGFSMVNGDPDTWSGIWRLKTPGGTVTDVNYTGWLAGDSEMAEWLEKGKAVEGLGGLCGDWHKMHHVHAALPTEELLQGRQRLQLQRDGLSDSDPKVAPMEFLVDFSNFCIARQNGAGGGADSRGGGGGGGGGDVGQSPTASVTGEPQANRIWDDRKGRSTTMKMLTKDKELQKLLASQFTINGCLYCRSHLKASCHICEVDFESSNDDADAERRELGLRPVGDPALNAASDAFAQEVLGKRLEAQLTMEGLQQRAGGDAEMQQRGFGGITQEMGDKESELNQRFLTLPACSQCAYWKCKTPAPAANDPLLKCGACKVVKYCCQEHQRADWTWEHKGECCAH